MEGNNYISLKIQHFIQTFHKPSLFSPVPLTCDGKGLKLHIFLFIHGTEHSGNVMTYRVFV